MKYKTLVRIAVKLIGVWMVLQGIVNVLVPTGQFMYLWTTGSLPSQIRSLVIQGVLVSGAHLAVGLYLYKGGQWIVDAIIPSNRPYCHDCGYELTGTSTTVCPECGTPFKR